MGAALTLLVLMAGSLVIVRIASVALRLTGLPDHVARFQSISALTGAGFTTTESEAIVNFPIRRKVIVSLMILGNLGLVSVLSTFVIAFTETVGDTEAMIRQGVLIIAVIAFIAFVMTNKTLDRLLCGFVSMVLQKLTKLDEQSHHILLEVDSGHSVSEHIYRGRENMPLEEILPSRLNINILSIKGKRIQHIDGAEPAAEVGRNETLVCYGSEAAHLQLSKHLKEQFPFQTE